MENKYCIGILDSERGRVIVRPLPEEMNEEYAGKEAKNQTTDEIIEKILEHFEDTLHINIQNDSEWMIFKNWHSAIDVQI